MQVKSGVPLVLSQLTDTPVGMPETETVSVGGEGDVEMVTDVPQRYQCSPTGGSTVPASGGVAETVILYSS